MATEVYPLNVADLRVHSTANPTVTEVYDTNLTKYAAQFADAVDTSLHFAILLPSSAITGNMVVKLKWRTASAAASNAYWEVKHILVANGGLTTSGAVTSTKVASTNGGAGYENEVTLTVSLTSPGGSMLFFSLSRLASDALDTLNGETITLLTGEVSFISDVTVRKGFIWISPAAMRLTGAVLSESAAGTGSVIHPHSATFRDAQSDYGVAVATLPSNFSGNLKAAVCFNALNDNGGVNWQFSMGKRSLGGAVDPALTSGSSFTVTPASTFRMAISSDQTAPISPAALDDLVVKVTRLGSADTNSLSVELYGVLLTFDTFTRNPQIVMCNPGAFKGPATGNATPISIPRTNFTEIVQRFSDGSEQATDIAVPVPTTYMNGGTLVVRWSSPAASGSGRFRLDYASPAPAASSTDPALTAGTEVQSVSAGADLLNEVRLPISGLLASDMANLRLVRAGDDTLDTLGNQVDVLTAYVELNVSA